MSGLATAGTTAGWTDVVAEVVEAEVGAGAVVLCAVVEELVGIGLALLLVVALAFGLEDVVVELNSELLVVVVEDTDDEVDVEVEDVAA